MSPADPPKSVRRALYVYLGAILCLTAVALAVVWFRDSVLHLPYPYNSLLFFPSERFSDLTHYYEKCRLFAATGVFAGGEMPTWIYPAPSAYVQCFILNDIPRPVLFLTWVTVVFAFVSAWVLWVQTRKLAEYRVLLSWVIFATLLTSYPFAYLIDRGNQEVLVMAPVLLFLVFFARERYLLASLTLVVAACIKPYPVLFFAMLLFRRRFREIAIAALVFIPINYIALAGLGTPVAESYRGIQKGMQWFLDTRVSMMNMSEIGFDHSLFTIVKRVYQSAVRPFPTRPDAYAILYKPYFLMSAAVGVVTLLRIWRMPVLNQFFALTIITVLFPWVSYDYTLIQMYLPWGLFLIVLLEGRVSYGQAVLVLVLFAVLFTPQSYLFARTSGFGGQIKALALLILFLASLRWPWPSRTFGEREL